MTTTINPEGKTPWEVYGLAEERMRESAGGIAIPFGKAGQA
jgi:hypothetical protein